MKKLRKNCKKVLTTLDKRAIIVNCIIIAYYALFAPILILKKRFAKIRFDILYMRVREHNKRPTARERRSYYFEWSD